MNKPSGVDIWSTMQALFKAENTHDYDCITNTIVFTWFTMVKTLSRYRTHKFVAVARGATLHTHFRLSSLRFFIGV